MNLINSDKKNYFNVAYYLILLLPLSIVFSRFVADLSVVILSIIFFFIFEDNKIFKNKLLVFAFAFVFFASVSSVLSDHEIFSLKSSVLYLRFILFILTVSILFLYFETKLLKVLFNILLCCYIILLFDATFQFIFKHNIFGYTTNPITRVSSLFFSELILGSYLSRLFPLLCFLYVFLKLRLNNFFILYFLLHLYFVVFITGERLAFAILNIYYFMFGLFYFKKLYNKFLYVIVLIITFFCVSYFSSTFEARSSLKTTFSGSMKQNYTVCDNTKTQIKTVPELSERWKINGKKNELFENKTYTPNCDPIFKIFGIEFFYIFSVHHFNHYLSAFEIFKDNKSFGVGPKNFRKICKNEKYYLNKFSCSTHPHNYFIQILAETGIVGFFLFSSIYLIMFYFFVDNFFRKNNKNFLTKYILLTCFLINFFPIFPSGNFFNNWNAIVYTFPLGFLLGLFRLKN